MSKLTSESLIQNPSTLLTISCRIEASFRKHRSSVEYQTVLSLMGSRLLPLSPAQVNIIRIEHGIVLQSNGT
jgi:hypothetical protein